MKNLSARRLTAAVATTLLATTAFFGATSLADAGSRRVTRHRATPRRSRPKLRTGISAAESFSGSATKGNLPWHSWRSATIRAVAKPTKSASPTSCWTAPTAAMVSAAAATDRRP